MILSVIISIIAIFVISKNCEYLANKFGLVDRPSKNKIHKNNVALLGGAIIFLILLIFLFINYKDLYLNHYQLFYLTSFFILGLIDDRINLNSNYKILIVIIFSSILIFLDESFLIHKIYFEISNNEYYFGKLKIPVTLFCILLMFIAINMSDGINCLLISFSIFALLLINYLIFNVPLDILDFAIVLTLTILIYFNYKNIIFLGNSGAGLLSAYFIYKLINKNYFIQIDVFEVISIFLIMGIDMVRLVILRLLRKKNPFERDLNHFHHLLLKKISLTNTIIFYLVLSFIPIIFSNIMKLPTLFFIPFTVIIYFYAVKELSKSNE